MTLLLLTAYEVKVNWGLSPTYSSARYYLRSEGEVRWGHFGVKVKRKCLLFGLGYIKGAFV